ncbi:MAG: Hsp20/alpha crystallin family protein [Candidatus Pacebacteria bacterium]|nr:Hsp20/alpha crystallin family protein [Candidatus Paceibacterota bacterium]
MAIKKRSFFERLSGSTQVNDEFDVFDDDFIPQQSARRVMPSQAPSMQIPVQQPASAAQTPHTALFDDEPAEGQLPVDVYQTPSEIVIRTFIAGVRPDEMNVSISRDQVVIEGAREERASVAENDYFHHELFWGAFSRVILLPQEVDVENSSAGAKDGLLTIILPKLDKARQTKLRIKAS